MKFGVVIFPGSNCDQDMVHVLRNVAGQEVEEIWHKETTLKGFTPQDCIIVPGGFSYGDYLRTGAIARFSPIMEAVIQHANNGGIVWGICNGFQILCEAGLLPGVLLRNNNQKYNCKNVWLKVKTTNSLLTQQCTAAEILKIPIAHGDGRYYADEKTIQTLQENNQILFTYCSSAGEENVESNPNGSLLNIAGICNANRNVFGMMPHPERASEIILGNTDGFKLFSSLIESTAVSAS
jgi:phosphoribosylformylglycinamidine synthase subunit PurQ / glutaminase